MNLRLRNAVLKCFTVLSISQVNLKLYKSFIYLLIIYNMQIPKIFIRIPRNWKKLSENCDTVNFWVNWVRLNNDLLFITCWWSGVKILKEPTSNLINIFKVFMDISLTMDKDIIVCSSKTFFYKNKIFIKYLTQLWKTKKHEKTKSKDNFKVKTIKL